MKTYCLVLLSLLFCLPAWAQMDSLKVVIAKSKEDSNKVNTLILISDNFRKSSADSALYYAAMAKKLAIKIGFSKGLGYSLKAYGMVYNLQGNYVDAVQVWKEALEVFIKAGVKVGVSNMYNNIGAAYNSKSMEDSAQEYFLKSLKIAEEIKDTLRVATALMNIGAVYSNKPSMYNKALSYYLRAFALSSRIDMADAIGTSTVNMSEIYLNRYAKVDTLATLRKMDLDSALYFLAIARDKYRGSYNLPYALNMTGRVFRVKKDFDKAMEFHQQAYDSAKVIDSKLDMAQALLGKAETLKEKGDISAAVGQYLLAETLFKVIGFEETYELENVYLGLAESYSLLKDFNHAFDAQKKLIEVRKKIYDLEVDKKLGTKLFAFDIEKKQGEINLQHEIIRRQTFIRNGLIAGFILVLLFAAVVFTQRNKIKKGKKLSDELLLNILPEEVAEELKSKGSADAKLIDEVTVLFTDFKGFTTMSEKLTPKELVRDIHECFSAFDLIMEKHGMEKIKTIGDSYMAAGGLPTKNTTHPFDAVESAIEIRKFIEEGKQRKIEEGKPFFEIRIGIHTGPVVAGIVGVKKFAYDIWGDTVNTASRLESSGEVGQINISSSTYEKVKEKFRCIHRGKIEAKNKGVIDMYFVEA